MLYYRISCNNWKDWWCIVGYQKDDETIMPLFIKTPEYIVSDSISQYHRNSVYKMPVNVFKAHECVLRYQKIWNEIDSQLLGKMITEAIKEKSRYMHSKLIKTAFNGQGQDVPYDVYWYATVVLKVDSVYKQDKNYHLQVYVEECKYTDAESQ